MNGSIDQSGNNLSSSWAGALVAPVQGAWGDGAAAGLVGHQDPPGLPELLCPWHSLAPGAFLWESKGKGNIPEIQLCRKSVYWCCAAAPGIEKNGKLWKESHKPHKQPHVCHLPARFLVLFHPPALWRCYFLSWNQTTGTSVWYLKSVLCFGIGEGRNTLVFKKKLFSMQELTFQGQPARNPAELFKFTH